MIPEGEGLKIKHFTAYDYLSSLIAVVFLRKPLYPSDQFFSENQSGSAKRPVHLTSNMKSISTQWKGIKCEW